MNYYTIRVEHCDTRESERPDYLVIAEVFISDDGYIGGFTATDEQDACQEFTKMLSVLNLLNKEPKNTNLLRKYKELYETLKC